MKQISIAIVGRPNVGKSALFNAIVGKKLSIVDEAEGVTRDRLYGTSDFFGRPISLIDTGGMLAADDPLAADITRQAEVAIEEADALIFVVDSKVGPIAQDYEVAKILRRSKKPIVLAINKVDGNRKWDQELADFSSLGIGQMQPISCTQKLYIAELLERLLRQIPPEEEPQKVDLFGAKLSVAFIGRTNVGKSSLLNCIAKEERALVSPLAGTTRDTIDSLYTTETGKSYLLIDTAGIRRRHKEKDVVEKFALIRTERAIERADLCVLIIDCQEGLTAEEKRIARDIEAAQKPCILLLNKWDLAEGFRMEHALKALENEPSYLAHCPKLIISAKTGRNVEKIFPLIDQVFQANSTRISTHTLNKALSSWMQAYHPPMVGTKRLRIYYMSQIAATPPTFVLFVNGKTLFGKGYERYIINQIRETFSLQGCPIKLLIRGKENEERKGRKGGKLPSTHTKDKDLSYISRKAQENDDQELED